jgi:dihydrofolate synthase / folylpolyglutamate synthase
MKGYSDALDFLYSLEKFGMVFGLENIAWILDLIDNPQRFLKTIHIAGTNGKGSVASMLSHILKEAGYRVGKYTSPHLLSFTERITIDEKEITEEEVAALTETIKDKVRQEDKNRFFTFFDFTTALAFEYFRRGRIDIAVIEVGLGGRLDSTNVIDPLVSIITNVSLDHTDYLGGDIRNIAKEKAGIVKRGKPVVTGAEGVALRIIEEIARSLHSPLYQLYKAFSYEKKADQVMSYSGEKSFDNLFISLKGDHQLKNGALALCVAELLPAYGFSVKEDSIRKGLAGTKWPGRLEVVHEKPSIILDGAHNPDGARTLAEFLGTHYRDKNKVLIFGVMKDKDYKEILDIVSPRVDTIILTKPATARALPPRELEGQVKDAIITEDIKSALVLAKSIAGDDDLILVTGSFYTVGEAKQVLNEVF